MKKEWILSDSERAVKRKSRIDKKYQYNNFQHVVICILCFVRNSLDSCQPTSNGNKRKPSVGVNIDLPSWHQDEEEETVHHQYEDFEQMTASKEEEGHHSAPDQNISDFFKNDNIRWVKSCFNFSRI